MINSTDSRELQVELLPRLGPVSKYLCTRSFAGLGATSGQSLQQTCKFRTEIIDLLYCMLLFFPFQSSPSWTWNMFKAPGFFSGFREIYLDYYLFVSSSFCFNPKRPCAELGRPWRPTPTPRKLKVTFVECFRMGLRQRLGSFLLWKSVERQYFFKEDI